MNVRRFIQLCGLVVALFCLSLIYGFVRSEAWFGVMISLFVGVVAVKAMLAPDVIRFGRPPDESELRRP